MHFAAESMRLEVVDLLLKHRADVNCATNDWKATPLHLALSGNDRSKTVLMVVMLLKAGADPNAKNVDGVTPLRLAVQCGDKLAARALLKMGAQQEDAEQHVLVEVDEGEDDLVKSDAVPLLATKEKEELVGERKQIDEEWLEKLESVRVDRLTDQQLAKLNSFYASQLQKTLGEIKGRGNVDMLDDESQ